MSFLDSIIKKKRDLKCTETIITCTDGTVLKETKAEGLEFIGKNLGFVVDLKPDNVPAEIICHLYLGSQDCCDLEVLEKYDIKTVLSVGVEAPVKFSHVNYKFVECLDLPESNLRSCLRECIPFIEHAVNQSCNVLVHCNAGVSRSTSVVIAYLMLVEGRGYIEAFNIVKNSRSCVRPNSGFVKQLQSLSDCV